MPRRPHWKPIASLAAVVLMAGASSALGTFSTPVDLSATGGSPSEPQIALAPDGSATVVWQRSNGSNNMIQAATRAAGSASFAGPGDVSTGGGSAYYPQVAISPDGAATTVWQELNGGNTFIKAATRAGGSASFGPPGKNKSFLCPHPLPMPDGTVMDMAFPPFTNPGMSWATGNTLNIAAIPTVPGSVRMKSVFKQTDTATKRHFKGNGIPNHPMGTFPIAPGSTAYDIYSQLPAQGYSSAAAIPVVPYSLDVTVTRTPKVNKKPTCIKWLTSGIITQTGAAWHAEVAATNTAVVDPSAALPTDKCWGHPYMGMYHNHGYSWKCFPNKGKAGQQSPLYGYALDGFGVYGPLGANGKPIKNSQLDECHGMTSKVMWEGKMQSIYHYVTNNQYPYAIGCFRGTPAQLPKAMQM